MGVRSGGGGGDGGAGGIGGENGGGGEPGGEGEVGHLDAHPVVRAADAPKYCKGAGGARGHWSQRIGVEIARLARCIERAATGGQTGGQAGGPASSLEWSQDCV